MGETTEELRQDIAHTRLDMSGTLDAIGDRVSPGRIAERRKNKMRVWGRSVRERVMGAGDSLADRADDMRGRAHDMTERLSDAPDHMMGSVKEHSQGSPLVAGGIAFGAGVLFGALFPPTVAEQRLSERAMDAAEPMKDQLQGAGRELVDHLKEPLKEAVEDVKHTAQSGAQQVKESAQSGGQQVGQRAQSS